MPSVDTPLLSLPEYGPSPSPQFDAASAVTIEQVSCARLCQRRACRSVCSVRQERYTSKA